jgi:hypothetical protein
MGLEEMVRSFSKGAFVRALRRLVPEIRSDDLVPGGAGVRAQALAPDGKLVDDFLIVERPRALHICNAPSPAATASLAIAEEIARRPQEHEVQPARTTRQKGPRSGILHAMRASFLNRGGGAVLGLLAGVLGSQGISAGALGETVVDYDIVYVRQPRYGDEINTLWPEVFHPARLDPGADLVLLHPDGSEDVLVSGGNGSVTDPFVSFDGEWVYYALFYDLREERLNYQRGHLPRDGADIFRIHVPSRTIEQLTFGEFTPNTGAGRWDESNPLDPPPEFNRLGYGILNLGPCPVPGGRVAFTSNRNGFVPPKEYTNPTLQLLVMDEDGSNVTAIAPLTISSALHPTILLDGRMMFSSHESQGLRDQRLWGIWAIQPDGRRWGPVVSAFRDAQAFHFMTQVSGGDLVVVDYYNLNNNGFGALYRMPVKPPEGTPAFHSAFRSENPAIGQTTPGGDYYPFRMAFTPYGMHSITPFTHGTDAAAPIGADGVTRVGKFTHPSGAPGGHLLVVWSPGPCNDLNRPTTMPRYDAGIYIIPDAAEIAGPDELVLVKNDPAYNEAWPRVLVPYSDVHGVAEPDELPWLPNDGGVHAALPAGTPFGLIGTSSFYKRESFPGSVTSWSNTFDGLDACNTSENGQSSNWSTQGSDAGIYTNDEIWAVRIVVLEPNTHRSYGPNSGRHFENHANERHRILGEIPLRKFDANGDPILDAEGSPDTSFLARIPADTPFTFQTIDRNGVLLNMAQTWHQVRPGEARYDCGGCHAHSQEPLPFETTAASRPEYEASEMFDLSKVTPLVTRNAEGEPEIRVVEESAVDVEFLRDIRPLLESHCVECHTGDDPEPPGNLVLDDRAMYGGLPGDYKRLAADEDADWGYPPVIPDRSWRQTNASRYVRKFQSRRSLLVWKVFGERLDGWTNADHPTESVPGDPATLPAGASPNEADLDFTGDIMPPAGRGVAPLTIDQKMTIARWIDLGCPIDQGPYGWFLDDLRPTLTVSAPRPGANAGPLGRIRIGMADAGSGIDLETFSVTADIPVGGRTPGEELADLAEEADGVHTIRLEEPIAASDRANLFVEVADRQGNITRVQRTFRVVAPTGEPRFTRGDCDDDGAVDVGDPLAVLFHLFVAGASAVPCEDACDTDDDGALRVSDPVGVLNMLFLFGPLLQPPFPGCGEDPTGDTIGCRFFGGCPGGLR